MTRHGSSVILIAVLLLLSLKAAADEYHPPALVKVQPVFFVPKGERPPSGEQRAKLTRHLKWTQTRYKELLGGRDTFTLADGKPQVYMAEQDLAFYRQLPADGAPRFVEELLRRDKCNRYNCPNIFVVVIMNPNDDYPGGGAQPFNGGFNTGGAVVILSSRGLDHAGCFQSTLQHELGHSFGLPHVDVYGYDMNANPSLMSYNPKHHTQGFQPSATPGAFIPEDIRGLALNHRVFPHLRYNPAKDCPAGYSIAKRIVGLGPMELTGQPQVSITTTSGEANGSKVSNIIQNDICPDEKPPANTPKADEATTFCPTMMWQSNPASSGWASVEIIFPFEVELTKVAVYSRHGGKYHAAEALRVVAKRDGGFRDVIAKPLASADATVSLPRTKPASGGSCSRPTRVGRS